MKIDIRTVPVRWINLDSATANAEAVSRDLDEAKFTNHSRFPAIVTDPADPLCVSDHPHMKPYLVGCGKSHIACIEESLGRGPFLVLEDDAAVTKAFYPIINIPPDTDAVYLGSSTGNPNTMVADANGYFVRIGKMLAAHAVLYISDRYKQAVLDVAKKFVYELHHPWDIAPSTVQEHFNVLASRVPFFIQSDARTSEHKWEFFTKHKLVTRSSQFERQWP